MIITKLNNRPRKLLGYKTPNEVFLINFNQPVALNT
ncbi:MAG: IS30 family transposase [Glaciecola sp.]|jgi:IS30 family transposase